MAHQLNHHQMKILETCEIAPPQASLPSTTTLPLTFLDIPWLWVYSTHAKRIFFFDFPHPTHHFLQTALPILKHSLSLTLQHFFPFTSNLILPPHPNHLPYIRYLDGDSLSLTVAESNADFTILTSDSPQDVRNLHPLVPTLPPTRTEEDGTRVYPLMAIQVTVLPNSGFSIGLTFSHVAADGKSLHHFVKFWASVCKSKEEPSASVPLPFYDREKVKDPKGLNLIHVQEFRNWSSQNMESAGTINVDYNDKVRATVVLSNEQVEKLKKWVSLKCTMLHISTFVVTCSLIWVSMIKSEEEQKQGNSDELCSLWFLGDCRDHLEFSLPLNYFGNCLASLRVDVKRCKLIEQNGVIVAAKAIERRIRDFKSDAMRGVEALMSDFNELPKPGRSVLGVAGSPKLGVYDTDFGWGKPKKSEVVYIDSSGAISLSDCRGEQGGAVEVGMALNRTQMDNFNSILEEHLSNIIFCDC